MRKCFIVPAVRHGLILVALGSWLLPCHGRTEGDGATTDTLTIVFTGDILLDRGVRKVIDHHGVDALFTAGVDSVFRQAQVVVGNLECPATKIQAPVMKRFIFRTEPEWLDSLRQHGFTHLNMANNHSIDQGRAGLSDTRHHIIEAGMTPVGAGDSMSQATLPILLSNHPRPVYLFASNRLPLENFAYLTDQPCISQEPMDSLIFRIAETKKADSTAIVIVSLHWGGEHTLQPVPRQRMEAHRIIDAGADALICHHTHTLQTIEEYHGHPIYYSIGNFIFDQSRQINARACMVRLSITKNRMDTETIPIQIQRCAPTVRNSAATLSD